MKNDFNQMKRDERSKLVQITFYLSPKDYHRFHSPFDFGIKSQSHIYGYLYPVKKDYISKHPDVYGRNERVCLFGEHKGGFAGMAIVGALNVGSIVLNHDSDLRTNDDQ